MVAQGGGGRGLRFAVATNVEVGVQRSHRVEDGRHTCHSTVQRRRYCARARRVAKRTHLGAGRGEDVSGSAPVRLVVVRLVLVRRRCRCWRTRRRRVRRRRVRRRRGRPHNRRSWRRGILPGWTGHVSLDLNGEGGGESGGDGCRVSAGVEAAAEAAAEATVEAAAAARAAHDGAARRAGCSIPMRVCTCAAKKGGGERGESQEVRRAY